MSTQTEIKYLLQMDSISKDFAGVPVLQDVRFALLPGEVHILAGENGAGKSTLIKILAGVYTNYSGQIAIDGRDIRFSSVHDAANAGISVIHQELSLVGPMSVVDNIFLGREHKGFLGSVDKKSQYAKVRKLFDELGIVIDLNMPVEKYSLCMQQMIEICKALAFECRIIVMDEPTSALNDSEVEKLFQIIDRLKKRGCGIIYISHKMEEIYRIADRITVLRDGRYIGTAPVSELKQDKLIKWMIGRELTTEFPHHAYNPGSIRLAVNNLTVPDISGKPFPMVDNVSFEVHAGEIVGIAGLQGSGNSEVLNALFGAYGRQVSGRIEINGSAFTPYSCRNAIKRGLALLTKDRKETGLVMEMDIIHNTTLASLEKFSPMQWLRPQNELNIVSRLARDLHIKAATLKQLVSTLSGGNQQKVVMAKWIETKPAILMLDEPTRGVDVGAKHEIYELMNKWTSAGISILLITSEMPELLSMSDRIIVMHRGKITAQFSREEATQEKILSAAMGQQEITKYANLN